ncbi:hypothetical protein AP3564_01960 [Aeribacillus pallidus]|uniref:Uncharacterized protein n=1 Tax=Aeribacillus pallidus TaxID=33936 RepID=A0A223E1U5_9BACI|nr:hypothetical protein AP3564_01960 [Aeribacillus pallidus]
MMPHVLHVLSSYICTGDQYLSANEKWAERKLPGLAEVQAALEQMFEELNKQINKIGGFPLSTWGCLISRFYYLLTPPLMF